MSPGAAADAFVLAADVGGTKTAFALAPARGGAAPRAQRSVPSADWPDFESLARSFLAELGNPRVAALGIAAAGPLSPDGLRIDVTHLSWRLDVAELARAFGARVALLNDVAASALGMLDLEPRAFALLQGDAPRRPGTLAVLAAGTGLGEAVLSFDGDRAQVLASEGGHASFAARNPRELELLRHLAGPDGTHVPVEAVVSGPGLVRIHAFLREERGGASEPRADAAAIADAGLRGDDPLSAEALELFVSAYGAEAGNLALRALSQGGVWLGGGIAPKLLPALRRGAFLEAFRAKGGLRDWLAALPVAVCLAEDAALRGALREARLTAREAST